MMGKGVATVAQLLFKLCLHIVGNRELEKVLTFRREPILENSLTSLIEHSHNALEHDRRLRFNNKMKTTIKNPLLSGSFLETGNTAESSPFTADRVCSSINRNDGDKLYCNSEDLHLPAIKGWASEKNSQKPFSYWTSF